jgi:hypothetical protein
MEDIAHVEYPGVGHLWCHRHADKMEEMADLVAVLVDETMTVAAGGRVLDGATGAVLKVYEGRLPAVLDFEVPETCREFVLEVADQQFRQAIPEDHGHEDGEDHHDDGDDDHGDDGGAPAPAWQPARHKGHRH